MQQIRYRDWLLEVDPEATRRGHSRAGMIGARACGCAGCRNFMAARDAGYVYPEEIADLLRELGLESASESEVTDFAAETDGRHFVSGWFHAVGRVLGGPSARTWLGPDSSQVESVPIADGFELGILEEKSVAPDSFRDLPLIQLEFHVRIPWLLNERDPDVETDRGSGDARG